ncbi:Mlr7403 protein [hydrothermal vent metagenome]|uniref:Mlr7403 protein n=1 Tax=hydrothermal vent metagenome TaxID=652676 RepID=A0A3B0TWW2_9ZZZZ
MSDIFREVEEELRQEKLKSLWKRYGAYVIAAMVLIVGAVGGYRFYQSWVVSQSGLSGAKYATALRFLGESKFDQAAPILDELAKEGYGAYPVLARFQEAASLAKSGSRDEAVTLYDTIANDASVDATFRDLARIRAGFLLVDIASPEEVAERMAPLATDDGIWRHTAREIMALSQYGAGNFSKADEIFDSIMADPAAPARLKSRAEIMRTLIAPKLSAEAS